MHNIVITVMELITLDVCIQDIKTKKQIVILYGVSWAATLNVAINNNEFI